MLTENKIHDVIIIGGGLAGLVSTLRLSQAGLDVMLIEKKSYPFHKVCGEYVSNEVIPFLQSLDADPAILNPAQIDQFILSSPSGKMLESKLDLGGFGVSRYTLDNYLYQKALKSGASFKLNSSVEDIKFQNEVFTLTLADGSLVYSKTAIGAFGKRSKIDKQLNREFINNRSPYIGVKYHVKMDFPENAVALHNFNDGYCGISAIEDGKTCICYLTTRQNLKESGQIEAMEKNILYKNPHLEEAFTNAEYLYDKPEVINEISFEPKPAVENHILMCGDAAGLITPLCGNGMALAIHSAKIATDLLLLYFNRKIDRIQLENLYTNKWNELFSNRLWAGRQIQKLFGREILSELTLMLFRNSSSLTRMLMSKTHGQVF